MRISWLGYLVRGIGFFLALLLPSLLVVMVPLACFVDLSRASENNVPFLLSLVVDLVATVFVMRAYYSKRNAQRLQARRTYTLGCPECGRTGTVVVRLTFFGFRDFRCPSCGREVRGSLLWGYRILYLIVVSSAIFAICRARMGGTGLSSLVLLVISVIALWEDYCIRQRVDEHSPD